MPDDIYEKIVSIDQEIERERRKLRTYLRTRIKYAAEIEASKQIIANLEEKKNRLQQQ